MDWFLYDWDLCHERENLSVIVIVIVCRNPYTYLDQIL